MERYKQREHERCIKCGWSGIPNSAFRPAGRGFSVVDLGEIQAEWDEAISRTCMNCGYEWFESPLDSKAD